METCDGHFVSECMVCISIMPIYFKCWITLPDYRFENCFLTPCLCCVSRQVEQGLHVDQVVNRMTGFTRAQVR